MTDMAKDPFGDKRYKGGRPSYIDTPEGQQHVAECFAAGMSRQAMCDELGVKDKDTISRWRRDPRIKAKVMKLIEDRAIQISRKVDSIIEGRLSQAENLDTETLIKIRKEYGGASVQRREVADDATVHEAMEVLENNPEAVEQLERLLRGEPVDLVSAAPTDDFGPED